MIEATLSYHDLGISPADIYEQMGYGNTPPDEATAGETLAMIEEISGIVKARYCFFITDGSLDTATDTLSAMGYDFSIGKIIARQLRGSQRYTFFVATAGQEFGDYLEALSSAGDMVKIFIADAIGSVIAEKAADMMELSLASLIAPAGWKHTNRFSPGYCGWHVSGQQKLFSLFPTGLPCGVTLTPSSLMLPIKSVSGVLGIGAEVRKLDYSCGLCDFKQCYKRKLPPRRK